MILKNIIKKKQKTLMLIRLSTVLLMLLCSCSVEKEHNKLTLINDLTNLSFNKKEINKIYFLEDKIDSDVEFPRSFYIKIILKRELSKEGINKIKNKFYYSYLSDSQFLKKEYNMVGFWDFDTAFLDSHEIPFWKSNEDYQNFYGSFYNSKNNKKIIKYDDDWNGKILIRIEKKIIYIFITEWEPPR